MNIYRLPNGRSVNLDELIEISSVMTRRYEKDGIPRFDYYFGIDTTDRNYNIYPQPDYIEVMVSEKREKVELARRNLQNAFDKAKGVKS